MQNRPCSRPVYWTPKMYPGRAAESGFFWVGSEDSHARIAAGDCQVKGNRRAPIPELTY